MNNTLLSIVIAVLFGIGTFLILRRDIVRVIIGLSIMSHAVNLLIVSVGVFSGKQIPIQTTDEVIPTSTIFIDSLKNGVLAPILNGTAPTQYVDPLVQALVLTAIVISLATTAVIIILAYRLHEEYGTTDIQKIKRLWG
jgi:multicomponent Na+:H+ antiporter subunit C